MLETAAGGNLFRRIAYLSIAALGVGLLVSKVSPFRRKGPGTASGCID